MPKSLRALMYLTSVLAVGLPGVVVAVAAGIVPPTIGGQAVSVSAFVRIAGPPLVGASILLGLVALGVSRAKRWAATALLTLWALVGLYGAAAALLGWVPASLGWRAAAQAATLAGASALYLWRNRWCYASLDDDQGACSRWPARRR